MSYFVRRIMKTITFDNSTVKKSSFTNFRSSGPEVFLGKGVLKICSKFTGDRPCESAISIKLLHIFRTTFLKNTSGWLLLQADVFIFQLKKLRNFVYYILFYNHRDMDVETGQHIHLFVFASVFQILLKLSVKH